MELNINTQYKPLSFDDLLKPYALYGQAYQNEQNDLSAESVQSGVLANKLNPDNDPNAYNMYNNYATNISNAASELSKNGLTPGLRNNIVDLKSQYAQNIAPILEAYTRRQQLEDERAKALMADPSLVEDAPVSSMSIDDLIANPAKEAPKTYSGNMLQNSIANQVQNLANRVISDPDYAKSILGGDYYLLTLNKGYTPDEVLKVIEGSNEGSKILRTIKDNAIAATGITNPNAVKQLDNLANGALWKAVGVSQTSPLENWRAKAQLNQAFTQANMELDDRLKYDTWLREMQAAGAASSGTSGSGVAGGNPPYKEQSTTMGIEADNNLGDYKKAIDGLKGPLGQGASARIFGGHFERNPIKMYEEYHTALASLQSPATFFERHPGVKIISDDQYKALKALGFKSTDSGKAIAYNMDNKLNNLASKSTLYSLNVGDNIKYPGQIISNHAKTYLVRGKNLDNAVQYLDSQGNIISKKPDIDDLVYKKSDGTNGDAAHRKGDSRIIDIGFSYKYPNKLVVTNDAGKQMLIDPNLYSDQIGNFMKKEQNELFRRRNNMDVMHTHIRDTLMPTLLLDMGFGTNKSQTFSNNKVD